MEALVAHLNSRKRRATMWLVKNNVDVANMSLLESGLTVAEIEMP